MDFLFYFNWFDYFLCLFIGTFIILGIVKGFYQEFISVSIWTITICIAWVFRDLPNYFISSIVSNKEMQEMFSFLLIFIIVFLFFRVIGKALIKGINAMSKSPIDRFLGGFMGFAKGSLISITFFLIGDQYILKTDWFLSAYLSENIYSSTEFVISLVGSVPLEDLEKIKLENNK